MRRSIFIGLSALFGTAVIATILLLESRKEKPAALGQDTVAVSPAELEKRAEELLDRGTDAVEAGNLAEAIADFNSAIRMGHESNRLYYNLGTAHAMGKRYGVALPFFKKALELAPNDPETMYFVAQTLTNLRRGKEALTYIRKLRANNQDPFNKIHFLEAEAHKLAGDPNKTLESYKRHLTEHPNDHMAVYNVGNHYMRIGHTEFKGEGTTKNYGFALSIFALVPKSSFPAYLQAQNNSGAIYRRTRDAENAIRCYEAVVNHERVQELIQISKVWFETYAVAQYQLGAQNLILNNPSKAIHHLSLVPKNSIPYPIAQQAIQVIKEPPQHKASQI